MQDIRIGPYRFLYQQEDTNDVLYDAKTMVALWDKNGHVKGRPHVDDPVDPIPPVVVQPSEPTGGFVEHASSRAIRPRLTPEEIATFMPERGPFIFPEPYGTRGIRITNSSDGIVYPVGMAYWPNINAHAGQPVLFVVVSVNNRLTLYVVDKRDHHVEVAGQLEITPTTGEGCYWSLSRPNILYVPAGQRLRFYDVTTGQGGDAAAAYEDIRQCHSSWDGEVHSFTLNGRAAVSRNGDVRDYPSPYGGYDECQILKGGRYLLIREGDGHGKTGNRIVDLHTDREWSIAKRDGALGHCDTGWDYAIGEEDQTHPGGVFRRWDFTPEGPVDGGVMYATDWTAMTRYVSHCNARQGQPHGQHVVYSSSHDGDVPRANEIVVGRLDGSLECRVLCPNLNDMNAPDPHGEHQRYWRKTRANIDPPGEYVCVAANMGTSRVDIVLAQL